MGSQRVGHDWETKHSTAYPSIESSRERREKVNTLRQALSPQGVCKTRNRTWGQGCLLFNRQTQLEAEEAPEYPIMWTSYTDAAVRPLTHLSGQTPFGPLLFSSKNGCQAGGMGLGRWQGSIWVVSLSRGLQLPSALPPSAPSKR